jgi:hypothetical protein
MNDRPEIGWQDDPRFMRAVLLDQLQGQRTQLEQSPGRTAEDGDRIRVLTETIERMQTEAGRDARLSRWAAIAGIARAVVAVAALALQIAALVLQIVLGSSGRQ